MAWGLLFHESVRCRAAAYLNGNTDVVVLFNCVICLPIWATITQSLLLEFPWRIS